MTEKISYKLTIGTVDDANVVDIEDLLQMLLMDLYEQGDVTSVKVTKDGYVQDDEDMYEVRAIIDSLNSEDVQRAIDLLETLESFEEE